MPCVEGSFLGSKIVLLLKLMHNCSKGLLALRRGWTAGVPKKFARPIMGDPIIRYWSDALSAGFSAGHMLAELSVDQGGELGSTLQRSNLALLHWTWWRRRPDERLWHRVNVDCLATHHDDRS
jgi:hypothetical protein